MKQALKSLSFFTLGILLAAGLLYFYADVFFDRSNPPEEQLPETIAASQKGEAVITRISGEVFIIRNDAILTPLPGDSVKEGDIIKVVDDSLCQVRFAGTASLRIRSNTLVRIQKLLSGNKDADIRTELLTGSMIYKVEELTNSANLQILAQERIYRVEGTEFMVQALPNSQTTLQVLSGRVSVFALDDGQNESFLKGVDALHSIVLEEGLTELPEVQPLSPEGQAIFREEAPEEFSIQRDDLVYLQISSRPEGAHIYINGRLNGQSSVKGLFLPDEELTILLRKRGYKDETLRIVPGELSNRNLIIDLTPLGLDQTLEEEQSRDDTNPAVEQLKLRHQEELAELRSSFTQKLGATDSAVESLKESEAFLMQEKSILEEELSNSRDEARKLRELIKQIQELAEDQ